MLIVNASGEYHYYILAFISQKLCIIRVLFCDNSMYYKHRKTIFEFRRNKNGLIKYEIIAVYYSNKSYIADVLGMYVSVLTGANVGADVLLSAYAYPYIETIKLQFRNCRKPSTLYNVEWEAYYQLFVYS